MKKLNTWWCLGWMVLGLVACSGPSVPEELLSGNGNIQAVVEIPAGEVDWLEWNREQEAFVQGPKETLDFLPFPGNYGFIPGTEHPQKENGSGKELDVLVLAPREEVGTVMEIQPIALLKLQRNKFFENKVIAVPLDSARNTLDVKNYYEFQRDHYLCKNMLMEWFLHVYRSDSVIFIGWENERTAEEEIRRRKTY
jgi:inorganic pyrophosphatase